MSRRRYLSFTCEERICPFYSPAASHHTKGGLSLFMTVFDGLMFQHKHCVFSLEDFDGEEVDEEALIEQRRQQRLAIVQVCAELF